MRRLHAKNYVKSRVALIGDAAHTCHPLAGQGVNLGLADVHVLSNTINEALESGHDIGSLPLLEKYGNQQFRRNELALGVLEGLKLAYDINVGPFPALRKLGVTIINNISPLKEFLKSQAMGKTLN